MTCAYLPICPEITGTGTSVLFCPVLFVNLPPNYQATLESSRDVLLGTRPKSPQPPKARGTMPRAQAKQRYFLKQPS